MRFLLALLLMTTAAQAQINTPTWQNGSMYPHMPWPGYCAPPPFHPADIPTGTRNCPANTEDVPAFSIDGGISFKFPGEAGYDPNEIEDRRRLLIQQAYGQEVGPGGLPNVVQFTGTLHVTDMNFDPWPNTLSPGNMCTQTAGSSALGAPRIINQGYCNPQTGNNDEPGFGNMANYADNLFLRDTGFNGAGRPGFPGGDNNMWWVYYPARNFNNRVLVWLSGTAGWCNWPSMGNAAGSRPVMARALNEGFAVAMGFGRSCSGWSAGIPNNAAMRPFFMPMTSFIDYYEQHQPFEDYNQSGNSRGGMFTRMCALDPRIKVAYGQSGLTPTWMFSTGQPIQFYHGQDGDDKSPFWLSLAGLLDEYIMCASGEPGARLRESAYFWNDQYFSDNFISGGTGVATINPAGWNGQARCFYRSPCDNIGLTTALTFLGQNTNAAQWGLGSDTEDLVPPENFGGVRRFGPSANNDADGTQHTTGRLGRATLFTDLWQVGPRARGRMHGRS